MALRDQPYIPLYVQDFLTDEKLIECSAESTGVYIRLICILHKSDEYGKILLKQKDKQDVKQVKNFASKLLKQMPYSLEIIERAIDELLIEGVLQIEEDYLFQKRMVRDNEISIKRAESGKKGGKKTQFASQFAKAKNKAKHQANSENEYEDEYEDESEDKKEVITTKIICEIVNHLNLKTGKSYKVSSNKTKELIKARWNEGFTLEQFKTVIDNQTVKWKTDAKMCEYLRPETLFSTKFESYLNAKPNISQANVISPSSLGILEWGERKQREAEANEQG